MPSQAALRRPAPVTPTCVATDMDFGVRVYHVGQVYTPVGLVIN
jgi:hypothetical protein